MSIKAWNWEEHSSKCTGFSIQKSVFIKFYEQTYEGHTHYTINLTSNPKDANTFLFACLDRTVKMWFLGSSTPNSSMEAHEKGVNYVDFYPGADQPYLVITGDDKNVKVWDYLSN
jgi:coatomer subunit beta'